MFIAASYGMRRAEVIAHNIHDIVNITINQRVLKTKRTILKPTLNPIRLSSKPHSTPPFTRFVLDLLRLT